MKIIKQNKLAIGILLLLSAGSVTSEIYADTQDEDVLYVVN